MKMMISGMVRRKTLVLDLDETLIHSHHDGVLRQTVKPGTPPDFVLKVVIDRHPVRFFVHKRPHVDFFLEVVCMGQEFLGIVSVELLVCGFEEGVFQRIGDREKGRETAWVYHRQAETDVCHNDRDTDKQRESQMGRERQQEGGKDVHGELCLLVGTHGASSLLGIDRVYPRINWCWGMGSASSCGLTWYFFYCLTAITILRIGN